MQLNEHPKRGHTEYRRARMLFYCALIMFVVIEILFFLVFSVRTDKKMDDTAKYIKNITSDTQAYPEYDETAEWGDSVTSVAAILGVTEHDADIVLHGVANVYQKEYGRQFYFFNSFEKAEGTDDHYVISSGDRSAKFEVKIKNGNVTFVQNLGM